MAAEITFGNIDFPIGKPDNKPKTPRNQKRFRIGVIGNFAGTHNEIKPFTCKRVDRDDFDDMLAKWKPQISIQVAGEESPLELAFRDLDEFHPDYLFDELPIFNQLRQLKRQLNNSNTFDKAAEEILSWGAKAQETKARATQEADQNNAEFDISDLLTASLEETQTQQQDIAQSFIQQVVGQYVVPSEDPRKDSMIQAVDEAISTTMRQILHHPNFQYLESIWRSLYLLVKRIETDTQLTLEMIQLKPSDLKQDLLGQEQLNESKLYKTLVTDTVDTPGGTPFDLLLGYYEFTNSDEDAQIAARIAQIASQADTAFIAAAAPSLLGVDQALHTTDPEQWPKDQVASTEAWQSVRRLPAAQYLALVAPSYLVRYPYGKKFNRIDRFEFEEIVADQPLQACLWGNGATVVACLMAQSFTAAGPSFSPGVINLLENLPLFIYHDDDGEQVVAPCAEVWLTDTQCDQLASQGILALRSVKQQDQILTGSFVSFSIERSILKGSWS